MSESLYESLRKMFPYLEGDVSEEKLLEEVQNKLNLNEFSEEDVAEDLLRTTELRNSVLSVLKRFENQLISASLSSSEDEEDEEEEAGTKVSPVPEFLDEDTSLLRAEAFETIRHLFLESHKSKSQFSSSFYETAVYDVVADRIRRSLGYYQALYRSKEEIQRICSELGDADAIQMDLPNIQKVLYGLDEVQFVRSLGMSLGVTQPDLDEVVKNLIVREFAPLRRREI